MARKACYGGATFTTGQRVEEESALRLLNLRPCSMRPLPGWFLLACVAALSTATVLWSDKALARQLGTELRKGVRKHSRVALPTQRSVGQRVARPLKNKPGKSRRGVAKAFASPPRTPELPPELPPVVADKALEFLGMPYAFGAQGRATDCSALVQRVFSHLGIGLPRSAREQFRYGIEVSREQLAPGDLVFFRTYRRDASHVGIYLGDGLFIHAATRGGRVQIDSLEERYYTARYLGARRLVPES